MKRIFNKYKDHTEFLGSHIVIVGANDIGIYLAQQLGQEGENVFLIDEREENFNELDEDVDVLTITGNPIAVETLRKAGAGNHSRLVAVTDSDDLNLMLLFLGQRIGIKEGYALINDLAYYQSFAPLINRSHGRLYLLNLWEIVIQKLEERNNLEVQLIFSDPEYKFSILAVKFFKSHNLIGQRINQFKISNKSKVLKVIRNEKFFKINPGVIIEPDDIYLIRVDGQEHQRLQRQWIDYANLSKIMIGGDGFVQAMQSHWPSFSNKLVCIEKDIVKCKKLLKTLGNSLVLKGDSLDISLLNEAGIEDCQLFVAAAENDEINLLSSLLARSFGVNEIFTILRKRQHTKMLERLRLQGILSIPQIIVEHFLSLFNSQKRKLLVDFTIEKNLDIAVDGLSLVYRGGVLIPTEQTTVRENEEIYLIKLKKRKK